MLEDDAAVEESARSGGGLERAQMDIAAGLFGLFVLFLFTEPAESPRDTRSVVNIDVVFDGRRSLSGFGAASLDCGDAMITEGVPSSSGFYEIERSCADTTPGELHRVAVGICYGLVGRMIAREVKSDTSVLAMSGTAAADRVSRVDEYLASLAADGVSIIDGRGARKRIVTVTSESLYPGGEPVGDSYSTMLRRDILWSHDTSDVSNCLRQGVVEWTDSRSNRWRTQTDGRPYDFKVASISAEYDPGGGTIALRLPRTTPTLAHVRALLVDGEEIPWETERGPISTLYLEENPAWASGVPCVREVLLESENLRIRLEAC